jgi:phage virion morphogenesis protein
MKITAKVDLANLMGVEQRLKNLKHFFQAVGELAKASIVRNFEEQGRPTKWKPLSEATLLGGAGYGGQRFTLKGSSTKGYERHLQGKQILITRGQLRNSINSAATNEHAVVGSNLVYAAIHNFGGEAGRKSARVFIPARPYVVLQDEDRVEMHVMLRRWVAVGA